MWGLNQWILANSNDRCWILVFNSGSYVVSKSIKKDELYQELAEALFGWLA